MEAKRPEKLSVKIDQIEFDQLGSEPLFNLKELSDKIRNIETKYKGYEIDGGRIEGIEFEIEYETEWDGHILEDMTFTFYVFRRETQEEFEANVEKERADQLRQAKSRIEYQNLVDYNKYRELKKRFEGSPQELADE